jgi:hypothetical protein
MPECRAAWVSDDIRAMTPADPALRARRWSCPAGRPGSSSGAGARGGAGNARHLLPRGSSPHDAAAGPGRSHADRCAASPPKVTAGLAAGCPRDGDLSAIWRKRRLSRSTAASGGQAASSVKPLPTGHAPDWPVPSSSLQDCLGRVRRVKAKPLRGRFASLDTAATAKGGQLRGVRGRCRARRAALTTPGGRRSVHDRRAISVPLARVTRGQPRPLADTYTRRSAPLAAVIAALPKLIVRVRFSSPAPHVPAQLRAGTLCL